MKFATANVTSWPGCQRAAQGLDLDGYDLVLLQEVKITSEMDYKLHGWARRQGWKAALSPSTITPAGGFSGGAAVMARKHIPLSLPPGSDSTCREAGRVAAAIVRAGPCGGFIAVSSYLFIGEGLSERNVGIVQRTAKWLFTLDRPFLWGCE